MQPIVLEPQVPAALSIQLRALLPYLVVAGGGLAVMLVDAFVQTIKKGHLAFFSQAVLIVAGLALYFTPAVDDDLLGGMIRHEGYAQFFNFIFLGVGLVTVTYATATFDRDGDYRPEFYPLLLFAILGMMVLASASDLMTLYLGLETMSLAVYVLVGGRKGSLRSSEAGMKYLLLGGFASAILLMGIALMYGYAGGTAYADVRSALHGGAGSTMLVAAASGLMLVGFSFKVAAVPFHMWTPDVYDGAPAYITGFMATAVKAAAFAALVRWVVLMQPAGALVWFSLLAVLAVLTMTVGNLIALAQSNIKRMLAYSSIAHAGYMLLGVLALMAPGRGEASLALRAQEIAAAAGGGVLFYLIGYSLMNLAVFGIINVLGRDQNHEADDINLYAGLARRQPVAAAAIAVAMFSLAGIPPTVGFMGKFYIFEAVVRAGLVPLAIWGVVNSLISVYYYLRVVVVMYMKPTEEESYDGRNWESAFTAGVLAVLVIFLGILPGGLYYLATGTFASVTY
ncbi:MAG: NADH-quinone oxidoreductase subunit N [Candidatus Krumholzibacteriia bacterium]